MVGLQIISIFALFLICSAGIVYQQCGDNAFFRSKASICRPYCDQDINELELEYCKSKFVSGCFCLPGYIRPFIDSENCIPEEDCIRLPKCGINETYKECANRFPRDCEDLQPRVFKGKCKRGCDCKTGYVRLFYPQSDCVLESDCQTNDYEYTFL